MSQPDYHILALVFITNFFFIGLKAFQQRNVVHNDYILVFLTSNLLAVSEVFMISTIAVKGFYWPLIGTIAVSGGLGCMAAMRFHNFIKRGKHETKVPVDRR